MYALADKYLQEDLGEKCLDSIAHNINTDNVYKILDFAHQESLYHIKNRCLNFLKHNLHINNVSGLIEYLRRQEDLEFREIIQELRLFVFTFVLKRFFDLYENENGSMQVCENFIITNIEMTTISILERFLSCSYKLFENVLEKRSPKEDEKKTVVFSDQDVHCLLRRRTTPQTKELFEERTIKLREAAFSFVHENFEALMASKTLEDFSHGLLGEFALYSAERSSKQFQDMMKKPNHFKAGKGSKENNKKTRKGNQKKRMEPIQTGAGEENPTLQKTKK